MSATRAEIDAQRAIAAKAWEEGARAQMFIPTPERSAQIEHDAKRWAAEEFPYPTVTRPRVVTIDSGRQWRIVDGVIESRMDFHEHWRPCVDNDPCDLMRLASLLTEAQLDEVRRGPCGPTETVEAE